MGCIGSRVALFRSCSLTSGSHSGSLTSSSGGLGSIGGTADGTISAADAAARRALRRLNTFSVQNVDDTGHGVSPGKLEVTETDLVLHVKGKLPLTWPLKSLRRYGFDNDLFSFESGRRCPTGAGIFAFRCHRAQSLFNLLQAKIQGPGGGGGSGERQTGERATTASVSLPTLPSTPITPTNNAGNNSASVVTTPVSSTFVYVNLSESSSSRILSSAPPIPPPQGSATGENVSSGSVTSSMVTTTSKTECSTVTRGPLLPSKSMENHPVYMNVDSAGAPLLSASASCSMVTTSFTTTTRTNIPPPTAPRRVSTSSGSEKSQSTRPSPAPFTSACSVHQIAAPGKKLPDCALYSNVFCSPAAASAKGGVCAGLLVGATTSDGGMVIPLPQQEPAELNYAELDLKPTSDRERPNSGHNSPFMATSRLGHFNRHHQLISAYSRTADPYDPEAEAAAGAAAAAAAAGGSDAVPGATGAGLPDGVTPEHLGYATIDFDKTRELNMITRSKLVLTFEDDDEPPKKSSLSKKLKYGTAGL